MNISLFTGYFLVLCILREMDFNVRTIYGSIWSPKVLHLYEVYNEKRRVFIC